VCYSNENGLQKEPKSPESEKHLLYVLKKADNRLRKAIMGNRNSHLLKTIVEIVLNTLQGNHKGTKSHINSLKKYKNALC